ncbi:MAG: hypothetical protein JRN52_05770 [Nitrososphaerota archaeon]|nr:hypothetical protein [Nitrososphaerota archaeon]
MKREISESCATFAQSGMDNRAKRYAAIERAKAKTGVALLLAHVKRTPKGKIRLSRVEIRIKDGKEEIVTELPKDDPRYVFEDDYKVRKMTHDLVKRSAKFGSFYASSARVLYDSD